MDSEVCSSNGTPQVSVVIGVYNGGPQLLPTLQSILSQQGVEIEVIVVNDGSSDDSASILEQARQLDSRLHVLHQPRNMGLTKALIRGCQAARGAFIARQDVGDISLPGRLAAQYHLLQRLPNVVLCSCWARVVGPEGELLGVNSPTDNPVDATRRLLNGQAGVTHHGAVMFRAEVYREVGGYRSEFYFAQDLDLWYRLLVKGQLAFLPQILYQIKLTPKCLSSRYRDQQIALAAIIREIAGTQCSPERSKSLLLKASEIRPDRSTSAKKVNTSAGEYWIASMLIQRSDYHAFKYLLAAIRHRPWSLKAWLGFPRLAFSLVHKMIFRSVESDAYEASSGV